MRLVYGVGINDIEGASKNLYSYGVWQRILSRCYSDVFHSNCPSYIGCTIHKSWIKLSDFNEWFNVNYIEGYQIDKDILGGKSKIYGPETCCYVPSYINAILISNKARRGDHPIGVCWSKTEKRFQSAYRNNGVIKSLGYFDDESSAFIAYKNAKEDHIKAVGVRAYLNSEIDKRVLRGMIELRIEDDRF